MFDMNCKRHCENWATCKGCDGTTPFCGKDIAANNVEKLCSNFESKSLVKEALQDKLRQERNLTHMIKDSGERREFESGAVRDIQIGKGRCDLMPIDIAGNILTSIDQHAVLNEIHLFTQTLDIQHIYNAIYAFCKVRNWDTPTALLEVSIHYEQGAIKYGERNWEKGIHAHSYIDSGIRHFLKYCRGDDDEPHDRAFIWNMLGLAWTVVYRPEFVDVYVITPSHSENN